MKAGISAVAGAGSPRAISLRAGSPGAGSPRAGSYGAAGAVSLDLVPRELLEQVPLELFSLEMVPLKLLEYIHIKMDPLEP